MLAPCGAVRFLCIRHSLGDSNAVVRGTLIARLCTFLEGAPVLAHTLEHLTLYLVERNEETTGMCAVLGARLTRVLKDPSRFPAFRKLTVRVQIEAWEEIYGRWVVPGLREADAKTGRRWREMFDGFREADIRITNGAGLDV